MNEAQAMMELPRRRSQISGELEAARKDCEVYAAVAGKFAALDTRPLLIHPESGVQRIGPDPVPEELRSMLRDAHEKRVRLEYELANALRY